eukprot:2710865-Prymnesium_polylepis.1
MPPSQLCAFTRSRGLSPPSRPENPPHRTPLSTTLEKSSLVSHVVLKLHSGKCQVGVSRSHELRASGDLISG